MSRSPSRRRTSARSPSKVSSSSTSAGCRKISRSTTRTASAATISWRTSSAGSSDSSCSPSAPPDPGSSSSTTPPLVRADGLSTTAPTTAKDEPKRSSVRSTTPAPMWRASAKRWTTAATTSSWEHAQIESWAEFRMTSSQARSSTRWGQSAAGVKRAARGSANCSSVRSATAAAAFTSVRFEATPMSRLARAPERSSPVHAGSPWVGAEATCSASERMTSS